MKLEKITKKPETGPAKRYNDACATAHAMEILGERWALLVVRELHLGPRRFTDIKAALPGISANVLTQRLEGLELAGVIRRRELPPPAASRVYELTAWGRESEPIFQVLGRWAARSPWHDPGQAFSAASFMLSLRTMFSAEKAGAFEARFNFEVSGTRLVCGIGGGELWIHPGEFGPADVELSGEGPALAGFIYGGVPLAALEGEGALTLHGDRAKAEALPNFFPLPERVSLDGTGA